MFAITRQEQRAILFIVIFISTGAVLKLLPFAMSTNQIYNYRNSEPRQEQTNSLVDINTAELSELLKLKGIGAAIASRIIEYREQNGQFESVEVLLNVKGIGPKKLKNMRDQIELCR